MGLLIGRVPFLGLNTQKTHGGFLSVLKNQWIPSFVGQRQTRKTTTTNKALWPRIFSIAFTSDAAPPRVQPGSLLPGGLLLRPDAPGDGTQPTQCIPIGVAPISYTRSSSREVRISWYPFSVLYFGRTLTPKKGKRALGSLGSPSQWSFLFLFWVASLWLRID